MQKNRFGCIVLVPAVESFAANELREMWSDRHNARGPGHAMGRRVAVDAQGNLIVLAEEFAGEGMVTLKVLKYDPPGLLLWTRELWDIRVWEVGRFLMAVDGDGFIHVSVNHLPHAEFHGDTPDIRTLLLDPDGRLAWQADFGEPETIESVSDLAVDGSGDTLITGSFHGREWITLRYDRDGNLLWTARHPGSFRGAFSFGWSLAVGDLGEVYVSGRLDFDLVTVRYDALGNLEWEAEACRAGIDFLSTGGPDRRPAGRHRLDRIDRQPS